MDHSPLLLASNIFQAAEPSKIMTMLAQVAALPSTVERRGKHWLRIILLKIT